jgi:hypothetical protein
MPGNGDLTITWDAANHNAMMGHIEALIAKGVVFHRLSEEGRGHRKVVLRPIRGTTDIAERKILLKAAEVAKIEDILARSGLRSAGASMTGPSSTAKIWRFMDLGRFLSLLSSKALYFACPSEFNDPYEGLYPRSHVAAFSTMAQTYVDQTRATRNQLVERYPTIDVGGLDRTIANMRDRLEKAFADVPLRFGISCWHKNAAESEAMWKLYSATGQGIAIESTIGQLREAISNREDLVVGDVRYLDFDHDPIEKGHENYGLFLKRKSFEHEKELRATVLLKHPGTGELVQCDLEALITRIHISPFAPIYMKEIVESVCSGTIAKIGKPIVRSELFDKPGAGFGLNLKIGSE